MGSVTPQGSCSSNRATCSADAPQSDYQVPCIDNPEIVAVPPTCVGTLTSDGTDCATGSNWAAGGGSPQSCADGCTFDAGVTGVPASCTDPLNDKTTLPYFDNDWVGGWVTPVSSSPGNLGITNWDGCRDPYFYETRSLSNTGSMFGSPTAQYDWLTQPAGPIHTGSMSIATPVNWYLL